nr:guanine nucleotide-binding protein G(I)/G(S)/G(O) subunit gamma-7 isoform X1 [Macaca fascicularis]
MRIVISPSGLMQRVPRKGAYIQESGIAVTITDILPPQMNPWSWHAGFEPALLARDSNSRNASRLPDVTKSPLESRSSPRPRPRPLPEPRPALLGAAYPAACPAPRPRSGLPPPGLAIGRAGTPGPAPRVSAPPPQRGASARGPGRRVRLRGGAEAAAGPERRERSLVSGSRCCRRRDLLHRVYSKP